MEKHFVLKAALLIVTCLPLLPGQTAAQLTPAPSSGAAANAVAYDQSTNSYTFSRNGRALYRYSVADGATLFGLKAIAENGSEFWPSYWGGIKIDVDGRERTWSDEGARLTSGGHSLQADTVTSTWTMFFGGRAFRYQFRFHIQGRTLVIRAEALDGSTMATGLYLERSLNEDESQPPARRIVVPYLPTMSILLSNGVYTSIFFDWEQTRASRINGYGKQSFGAQSLLFAQWAQYGQKTNGLRNTLRETIYLTVSPELDDVLPNLPGPVAPYRERSSRQIVVSYSPPFPWLLLGDPLPDGRRKRSYADTLRSLGVKNLAFIIKNWNNGQFDNRYPVYLPADPWVQWMCADPHWAPPGGGGGNDNLRLLRNRLVGNAQNRYEFAVHENYVDFYRNTTDPWGWHAERAAKSSNGMLVLGFENRCQGAVPVMKPAWVPAYVDHWSALIDSVFQPTWSYLDVHSAVDPSDRVDYDASADNPRADSAAMMLTTIHAYRRAAAVLRSHYKGPVEGEGLNHFYYAGYFDDFDGRIATSDPDKAGSRAPLLLDFDLLKIHPKSTEHGVGHIQDFWFFPPGYPGLRDTSSLEIQGYLATELAYGHGGHVAKANATDHTIRQAVLESTMLQSVHQACMMAMPTSITYWDGTRYLSASDYIRDHPGYDDYRSPDFMARVRVVYANSVEVYVNRSNQPWQVRSGTAGGWFTWNTTDTAQPQAGRRTDNTFLLKPLCGWVCYNPAGGP